MISMISFKAAIALLIVGLIVLSGCAQQQAPAQAPAEQPAPQAPAVQEPTPAPVVQEPTPAPVVQKPTAPSAPAAPTTAPKVGSYTGQTEQTTANKNASYWDCVKSKLGNDFMKATNEQAAQASRECVGYK